MYFLTFFSNFIEKSLHDTLKMPSNSLPYADLNLSEMEIRSPSCPGRSGSHVWEMGHLNNLSKFISLGKKCILLGIFGWQIGGKTPIWFRDTSGKGVCFIRQKVTVTKPTKWHVRPVWSVVFTVKKAWVLSYPLSKQRRLNRLGGCPG